MLGIRQPSMRGQARVATKTVTGRAERDAAAHARAHNGRLLFSLDFVRPDQPEAADDERHVPYRNMEGAGQFVIIPALINPLHQRISATQKLFDALPKRKFEVKPLDVLICVDFNKKN